MDTEPLELSPEGHSPPFKFVQVKKIKAKFFGVINMNGTNVYIYY